MKIAGYVLGAIGILALIAPLAPVKKLIPFALPSQLTTGVLTIAGIVLIGLGIIFLRKEEKSSGKQHKEVPVYEGNRIVAYRRVSS
ncbi:hypothetical protein J4461_01435 [Candidatus Pacearchaeota archaeon]|nr:hypothetical protein [Candidatus Pacearchaeota archaeon]